MKDIAYHYYYYLLHCIAVWAYCVRAYEATKESNYGNLRLREAYLCWHHYW